jgi:hypothetical protein
VIVSVPAPATQLEPEGVASLFAESMAWRRVQWLASTVGSAAELTTIDAALALAAAPSEGATAPMAVSSTTRFLKLARNLLDLPFSPYRRGEHTASRGGRCIAPAGAL